MAPLTGSGLIPACTIFLWPYRQCRCREQQQIGRTKARVPLPLTLFPPRLSSLSAPWLAPAPSSPLGPLPDCHDFPLLLLRASLSLPPSPSLSFPAPLPSAGRGSHVSSPSSPGIHWPLLRARGRSCVRVVASAATPPRARVAARSMEDGEKEEGRGGRREGEAPARKGSKCR
eukprot:scaffold169104_cov30-Tisochrysis_lutea.AAC.4